RMGTASTSSSDIDDEEAERLRSVAVDCASVSGGAAILVHKKHRKGNRSDGQDATPALEYYQTRAREFLHKYLDKTYYITPAKDTCASALDTNENSGFHLFKNAPSGLSEKGQCQEAAARRKRRFLNSCVDEASEQFQSHLLAAAIDGAAVKLYAEREKAKALALWILRQADENAAKQNEEERISLLKRQRGELWLPSVARDMQECDVSDGKPATNLTSEYSQNRAKAKHTSQPD
ncbi:hypothetical protein GOP47_0007779, partial [Adiantum capillus-veneris]